MLRVEARDGEADFCIHLETSGGRNEHQVGCREGIVSREDETTMVEPILKGAISRPLEGKVPLQKVVLLM